VPDVPKIRKTTAALLAVAALAPSPAAAAEQPTLTTKLAALAVAVAVFAGGAGTATAPEPAKLKAALQPSHTAVASEYLYSRAPTPTRFFPGGWTPAPSEPVGVACSTTALVTHAVIYKTIQAAGNLRRCA
jgi:hypothetical protein